MWNSVRYSAERINNKAFIRFTYLLIRDIYNTIDTKSSILVAGKNKEKGREGRTGDRNDNNGKEISGAEEY